MKELYVKPSIFFESFSFTQTIAKNCGDTHSGTLGESTHWNEHTCTWDVGGYIIFLDTNTLCSDAEESGDGETVWEDGEIEAGGACYNNPSGGMQMFSSC